MVIIRKIEDIDHIENSILTIGSFDGLHKGHMKIISNVISLAQKTSGKSVIITFDPHPRTILSNGKESFLQDIDDKIELLNNIGIDYLFIISFNKKNSNITAKDFLFNYIIKPFNPTHLIIGKDHHFGKNRLGNSDFLMKHQNLFKYNLKIISPLKYSDAIISSTLIKKTILKRDFELAMILLGRMYSFKGIVIKGEGIGEKIGYPTINIEPEFNKQIIPPNGVYCIDILIKNKLYLGMCNIGVRPTFYKKEEKHIEAHIINYEGGALYDEKVEFRFKNYLRDEKKYNNKNELILQLNFDKQECIKINNYN